MSATYANFYSARRADRNRRVSSRNHSAELRESTQIRTFCPVSCTVTSRMSPTSLSARRADAMSSSLFLALANRAFDYLHRYRHVHGLLFVFLIFDMNNDVAVRLGHTHFVAPLLFHRNEFVVGRVADRIEDGADVDVIDFVVIDVHAALVQILVIDGRQNLLGHGERHVHIHALAFVSVLHLHMQISFRAGRYRRCCCRQRPGCQQTHQRQDMKSLSHFGEPPSALVTP